MKAQRVTAFELDPQTDDLRLTLQGGEVLSVPSGNLTAAGFLATRGQQHAGGVDSPDARCPSLSWIHIEAKLIATCKMHSPAQLVAWDAQAIRDAGQFHTPLVIHRWNGQTKLLLQP